MVAAVAAGDDDDTSSKAGRKLANADRRYRVDLQTLAVQECAETSRLQPRTLDECGLRCPDEVAACDLGVCDPKSKQTVHYYIYVAMGQESVDRAAVTDKYDEILGALLASDLHEAGSAISLLRGEGRVEAHQPAVTCADLLTTYEIRLRHIRAMSSEHAQRLAAATSEFLSNLERHRAKAGRWITIAGSGEVQFNILRLEEGQLLGCLPIVSKLAVSSERWAEVWAGDV